MWAPFFREPGESRVATSTTRYHGRASPSAWTLLSYCYCEHTIGSEPPNSSFSVSPKVRGGRTREKKTETIINEKRGTGHGTGPKRNQKIVVCWKACQVPNVNVAGVSPRGPHPTTAACDRDEKFSATATSIQKEDASDRNGITRGFRSGSGTSDSFLLAKKKPPLTPLLLRTFLTHAFARPREKHADSEGKTSSDMQRRKELHTPRQKRSLRFMCRLRPQSSPRPYRRGAPRGVSRSGQCSAVCRCRRGRGGRC